MRFVACLLAVCALAMPAMAQSFECQTPVPFPFPIFPASDCEGVSARLTSGGGPAPSVESSAFCGFPRPGGAQYAYIVASGDNLGSLAPTPGGPLTRPVSPFVNEVLVPIPATAISVTFDWEFFEAENFPGTYNDVFEVTVVDALGNALGPPLIYFDTSMVAGGSLGTCNDPTSGGTEIGAPLGTNNGPQIFAGLLPPLTSAAFLSIVVANGADDAVDSSAAVDNIIFSNTPPCTWVLGQPSGPGTLTIGVNFCGPGNLMLMPVTFAPGSFPNGWAFGVDIGINDLISEITFGLPFYGSLDGTGSFNLFLAGGVPTGLPIYAGLGIFGAGGGGLVRVFPPLNFTTL